MGDVISLAVFLSYHQTHRSAGMFSTFNTVVQRENFIALWKGTSPVSGCMHAMLCTNCQCVINAKRANLGNC